MYKAISKYTWQMHIMVFMHAQLTFFSNPLYKYMGAHHVHVINYIEYLK